MLTSFPGCDDDCTSYHLWLVTGTGLLLTTTLKRTTLHEVRRALLTLLSSAQPRILGPKRARYENGVVVAFWNVTLHPITRLLRAYRRVCDPRNGTAITVEQLRLEQASSSGYDLTQKA